MRSIKMLLLLVMVFVLPLLAYAESDEGALSVKGFNSTIQIDDLGNKWYKTKTGSWAKVGYVTTMSELSDAASEVNTIYHVITFEEKVRKVYTVKPSKCEAVVDLDAKDQYAVDEVQGKAKVVEVYSPKGIVVVDKWKYRVK